jgi:hypothetical protein
MLEAAVLIALRAASKFNVQSQMFQIRLQRLGKVRH